MEKEKIQELWEGKQPKAGAVLSLEEHIFPFTEDVLFEAAKLACVKCKLYGKSQQVGPMNRVHEIKGGGSYALREQCSAPHFYLQEEIVGKN